MFTLLVLVHASLLKAQIKIGKQGYGTEPPQTRFMNTAAALASVFLYQKIFGQRSLRFSYLHLGFCGFSRRQKASETLHKQTYDPSGATALLVRQDTLGTSWYLPMIKLFHWYKLKAQTQGIMLVCTNF